MLKMPTGDQEFLAGVIEGFYGQPWCEAERLLLFDWMVAWKLNTYVYALKDDLKHRALWRERYDQGEAVALSRLITACQRRGLRFIYALSPGLDIRYGSETDMGCLRSRFEQMLGLGCRDFALLFDDIPDRMHADDSKRWSSFAAAQCHVTNSLWRWIQERCKGATFLFCPTPYCGRMAGKLVGGKDYLATVGRELRPEVNVFWTGPEIISQEITVAHMKDLQEILCRKPVIWDNLHANDYDGRRVFCGPYSGRPLELKSEVGGILANPNNELLLNYVPLRTLGQFVCATTEWKPREAYLKTMGEWVVEFATIGKPVAIEDLILFGDCFYLPHEDGPEAEALYGCIRRLLATGSEQCPNDREQFRKLAGRLRRFCVQATEVRKRPLFYALSRRIWELREELDLLEWFVEQAGSFPRGAVTSDFHLLDTYRGGFVARLQRLLDQHTNGSFSAAKPGQEFPAESAFPRQ